MNEELFYKIKRDIFDVLKNSRFKDEDIHATSAWNWVLKLKPDADFSLQIATLGHDIERGTSSAVLANEFENYSDYKKVHSLNGAKEIKKILLKYDLDDKIISKIYNLVLNHEVGGNEEADILRDADSLAYFDKSVEQYSKRNTPKKTRFKIKLMFNRASPRVQKIVKELKYNNKEIEEYIREL